MNRTRQATTAITSLRELAQLLARADLAVADVVARVGEVARDPVELMVPITLHPSLPGIRTAKLARYPDTGLPYYLALEFLADAMSTMAEFVAAFGAYRVLRHGLAAPVPLCFEPLFRNSAWTVVLVADLPNGTSPTDQTLVPRCTLRRDPV